MARPLTSMGAMAAWVDGMNRAGENLVPGVRVPQFGELGPHARLLHACRGKLVMQ
jgi:hypothetical protein